MPGAGLALALASAVAAPAAAWTHQEDGTGESAGIQPDGDRLTDLAFDGAGDVLWTGQLKQDTTGYDLVVQKLAGGTGEPLWRYDLAGDLGQADSGRAIDVDPARDVYVAAQVYDASRRSGIEVIKLDGATGAELWRVRADGSDDPGLEFPTDLRVGPQGDVFVCGRLSDTAEITQFTVLRFDASSGSELWRRAIDGGTQGDDQANALDFLASGDVVVAGRLDVADRDFAVIAFDREDGSELWRFVEDGSAGGDSDEARDLVVGPGSAVLVAGSLWQDTGATVRLATFRLDPTDGSEVWRSLANGELGEDAGAWSVAVDDAGDVAVGGDIGHGSSVHFGVLKLAGGSGSELWRVRRSGGSGNSALLQVAYDVAFDSLGRVVAVGRIGEDASSFDPELNVLSLEDASGAERWRVRRQGSQDEDNEARRVAIDSRGSVLVGGFLSELGREEDPTLLRLDGETGADFRVPLLGPLAFAALASALWGVAARRLGRRHPRG